MSFHNTTHSSSLIHDLKLETGCKIIGYFSRLLYFDIKLELSSFSTINHHGSGITMSNQSFTIDLIG